jgi:hypothetical protein
MNIKVLQAALSHYVSTAGLDANQMLQALEAFKECNQVLERYEDAEYWKDTTAVIPLHVFNDLVVNATYDEYDKLAAKHNGNVPFETYADICRNAEIGLEQLTNGQLMDAYCLITDVWKDNQ